MVVVLVTFAVAVLKHLEKANQGRKGLFGSGLRVQSIMVWNWRW